MSEYLPTHLRPPDGAVHLEVAPHEDAEGEPVEQHEHDHVRLADGVARLERQAHGELAVVGDAEQRQRRHEQRERPAGRHDVGGVLQAEALVEVHGVRDGVVALQRDHGQREHRQLRRQHAEEARDLARGRELPGQGELAELAQGGGVNDGKEAWKRGRYIKLNSILY